MVLQTIATIFATAVLSTVLAVGSSTSMPKNHPVPKNRNELTRGEWFPYVLSKIAPLEWWSYEESSADIQRRNYPGDSTFQSAKSNTWEFPRFCFSFFRPSTASFRALVRAVNEYQGPVFWQLSDKCIGAWPTKPTFYSPMLSDEYFKSLEEAIKNPPKADPIFVKKAIEDVPVFCAYLEKRLALTDLDPKDFDPAWLTREGLAESRGESEDFYEPGDWPVFLVSDSEESPSPTATRQLGMGVTVFQMSEIFRELKAESQTTSSDTDAEVGVPDFPLLSRLSDITNSAFYRADEIRALRAELSRAEGEVNSPESIRGLDDLIRIARLAEKLNLSVSFVGQ